MKISCPHCRQNYEVDESYAGQNVQCQNCGNEFMVTLPISERESDDYIEAECPICSKKTRVKSKLLGKRIKCQHCMSINVAKLKYSGVEKFFINTKDLWIPLIVLCGIIAFVIWGFVSCRSAFKEVEERVEKYGSVGTARAFVHDAITKRLKAPSTADIEITEDKQLDNEFTISGYVDAQNSFGAKIRKQFKAKVVYHPDKKIYMLAELKIY